MASWKKSHLRVKKPSDPSTGQSPLTRFGAVAGNVASRAQKKKKKKAIRMPKSAGSIAIGLRKADTLHSCGKKRPMSAISVDVHRPQT